MKITTSPLSHDFFHIAVEPCREWYNEFTCNSWEKILKITILRILDISGRPGTLVLVLVTRPFWKMFFPSEKLKNCCTAHNVSHTPPCRMQVLAPPDSQGDGK